MNIHQTPPEARDRVVGAVFNNEATAARLMDSAICDMGGDPDKFSLHLGSGPTESTRVATQIPITVYHGNIERRFKHYYGDPKETSPQLDEKLGSVVVGQAVEAVRKSAWETRVIGDLSSLIGVISGVFGGILIDEAQAPRHWSNTVATVIITSLFGGGIARVSAKALITDWLYRRVNPDTISEIGAAMSPVWTSEAISNRNTRLNAESLEN